MPIPEVTALIAGIKGTIDIAKGLKSAYDSQAITQAQTEILEKLVSLQMDALSLQEKHSSLIQEKDALAKRILENDNWILIQSQYKLIEISDGTFVYAPNGVNSSSEPHHWLCTNCFDISKMKSILQLIQRRFDGIQVYQCPQCKQEFYDRTAFHSPQPRSSPRRHW